MPINLANLLNITMHQEASTTQGLNLSLRRDHRGNIHGVFQPQSNLVTPMRTDDDEDICVVNELHQGDPRSVRNNPAASRQGVPCLGYQPFQQDEAYIPKPEHYESYRAPTWFNQDQVPHGLLRAIQEDNTQATPVNPVAQWTPTVTRLPLFFPQWTKDQAETFNVFDPVYSRPQTLPLPVASRQQAHLRDTLGGRRTAATPTATAQKTPDTPSPPPSSEDDITEVPQPAPMVERGPQDTQEADDTTQDPPAEPMPDQTVEKAPPAVNRPPRLDTPQGPLAARGNDDTQDQPPAARGNDAPPVPLAETRLDTSQEPPAARRTDTTTPTRPRATDFFIPEEISVNSLQVRERPAATHADAATDLPDWVRTRPLPLAATKSRQGNPKTRRTHLRPGPLALPRDYSRTTGLWASEAPSTTTPVGTSATSTTALLVTKRTGGFLSPPPRRRRDLQGGDGGSDTLLFRRPPPGPLHSILTSLDIARVTLDSRFNFIPALRTQASPSPEENLRIFQRKFGPARQDAFHNAFLYSHPGLRWSDYLRMVVYQWGVCTVFPDCRVCGISEDSNQGQQCARDQLSSGKTMSIPLQFGPPLPSASVWRPTPPPQPLPVWQQWQGK